LDSWKEEWVNMLEQVGNAKGLAYWEFHNAGNYKPANDQVPDQHLERFIRDKYIKGMWKNPDQSCAPHLSQPDDSKNGTQSNQTNQTQSRPQSVKTQDNSPAPQQPSFQQPQLQQQSSQASNTGLRKPTQTVGSINTSNSSNNQSNHGSGNNPPPTLGQVNSGIRLPTQPAPARAGMTSPLPQQYQGSTTAQSNQVVNVSKPKQQVDMDFESFFTDDSGSGNQSGNNQNPTQSVSTPTPTPSQQPLDILFGNGNNNPPMTPSGNPSGSVVVQGSSVQNTPNPNDPFALLSQQSTNGGSVVLPDKKDSILSLYDAPRSPQNNGQQFGGNMGMNNGYHQQQQQQQQYQQQNGMISPQYGGYGGYGGNMGMVSPYQQYPQQQQQQQQQQGFNPYSQQQMNQSNSNAVFGNYNYSQPQQSGMNRVDQKPNNNNTNNSHDVFAGLF